MLLPLPGEDDALLGRILLAAPEEGRSLEEVSRPNECAEKLAPAKVGPLASTYEDAQELAMGAQARAALAMFGFEGDARQATHFHYRLETTKRVARTDTTEYLACCKEKGSCGYGFVSALIYGQGEYATINESSAQANVAISIAASAGGYVRGRVLHRRAVRGYVAALVTVTSAEASPRIGVLGDPAAAGIELDEQKLPQQVKERFDSEKITVTGMQSLPVETAYVFSDANGVLAENEFVRRYERVSGSPELADLERRRTKAGLYTWGGLTVASAGLLTLGILNWKRNCDEGDVSTSSTSGSTTSVDSDCAGTSDTPGAIPVGYYYVDPSKRTINGWGVAAVVVGGLGVATFGTLFVMKLVDYDGSENDHALTKSDAQLYAEHYNRVLLRSIVRDTQGKMRRLSAEREKSRFSLEATFGMGFSGLRGTF